MSKNVKRIFDIIKVIGRSSQGTTFSEIQKLVEIPKSSLHNILKELQDSDIIEFHDPNKTYFISNEFNRIASICLSNINLLSQINTEISRLSYKLDETVHAGILSGRYVTYVAKFEGPSKISTIDAIGMSVPAHCSAIGKMLLTIYSDDELTTLYKDIKLEKYTNNTIMDFHVLQEELKHVRENEFSHEYGELSEFAACIAMPVYKNGKIAAAISITIPIQKFTQAYESHLLAQLKITTAKISDNLSFI